MFTASRRPSAPECASFYDELVHLAWGEEPDSVERRLLIRDHAKACDRCRLAFIEEWIDAVMNGRASMARPPNDILNEGIFIIGLNT